jgi:hypothetical protein
VAATHKHNSFQRGWWFELFTGAWLRKGYLPSDVETLAYIAAIAPEERSQFAAEYQTVLTAGGFDVLMEGPSGSPQYIHHSLACLYSEKYEVVEKEIDRREQARITKLYEENQKDMERAA